MKDKERQKVEAMHHHYGYKCLICDRRATQRAHCLGDTKLNRRVYGDAVVDDISNYYPACGLHHNKIIDIGFIQSNQEEIVNIIESDLFENDKRSIIEKIIRRNHEHT